MTTDADREVICCEVCVIGTGAAGGILAYRLAQAGRSVLSLEQGAPIDDSYFTNDLRPEQQPLFGIAPTMPWPPSPADNYLFGNAQAHALYAREDEVSTSSPSVFTNRQIFRLNGKTNLWGGVCLRQSPRDFLPKQHGDGDSDWPIRYEDMAPHYSAVENLIGVCGTREGIDDLPDGEFLPPLPLRPADRILFQAVKKFRDVPIRAIANRKAVETRPEQRHHCRSCGECINGCKWGSVYKFSSRLLPRIAPLANYRLRCSSKVVRLIKARDSARIKAVECIDTETRRPFRVEADTFVLSCGAMETPRILLNSAEEAFPDGLANRSGLVGRYLQDNVKVAIGTSLLRLVGTRRSYDVGSSDAVLIPRFLFDNQGFRGGYQAQYCHVIPKQPYYLDGIQFMPARLRPTVARLLLKSFVALYFFGKAEARRENRLVVGQARDRYAVPQLEVHFRSSDNDARMVESMIDYGKRILRKCSATVISTFIDERPGSGIHYAGTCRMAANPAEGVVDQNLRTFDHPNLYVCDGSVMPEISEKNLTLTIMALADRLANHFISS